MGVAGTCAQAHMDRDESTIHVAELVALQANTILCVAKVPLLTMLTLVSVVWVVVEQLLLPRQARSLTRVAVGAQLAKLTVQRALKKWVVKWQSSQFTSISAVMHAAFVKDDVRTHCLFHQILSQQSCYDAASVPKRRIHFLFAQGYACSQCVRQV